MKIKGHTEIQIRDAKTGRMIQNTHDDNMVTNGLAGFFKNHGMLNDTPFSDAVSSDLITTLLGGIMLFNDSLPASADTVLTPDGVTMTANATYGVTHTGDPTELGSYDANESGWQDAAKTTFRLVYNWAESQGNGVIKSAALTSRPHGFVGEGNMSGGKTQDNNNNNSTFGNEKMIGNRYYAHGEVLFAIVGNVAYTAKVDTTAQELTIKKHTVNDTAVDVRNIRDLASMAFEEVAVLANPSQNVNFATFNGISVRFLTDSVVIALRSDNGIIVLMLDSDMETIEDYAEITAAATGLTWGGSDSFFLTEDGDYLIIYNYNTSKVYKIEVDNPVNIAEVTVVGSPFFNNGRELFSNGKRHYCNNYVYDETLNKVIVTNNIHEDQFLLSGDIYQDDKTLYVLMSRYNASAGSTRRNNMYLATVNNLQNAVTKDSSQTMKVIYTLTFSD